MSTQTPSTTNPPEIRAIYLRVGDHFMAIDAQQAAAVMTALLDCKVYEKKYDPRDGRFNAVLVEDVEAEVFIGAAWFPRMTSEEYWNLKSEAEARRTERAKLAAESKTQGEGVVS